MPDTQPVIIVTGASRGIGLAVTRILLNDFGTIVASLSRTRTLELALLQSKYRERLLVIDCDITDSEAVGTAISTIVNTFNHIDAIVLNAGSLGPLARISSSETSLSDWKTCFEVNVFSIVHFLNVITPHLSVSSRGGRVVFLSSGAANGNTASWGAYNACKAAVNSLCRTYANEEPSIISVALRPGMVNTDMQTRIRSIGEETMTGSEFRRFTSAHESGTLVDPDDCGFVIASLAINAPKALSGSFVSWDREECKEFRRIK